MKIRFGIMGSGWRSELFIKIALANQSIFEITAVYVRNNEKKEYIGNKYTVHTTTDKNDFFNMPHDFVVDVVSKENKFSVLKELVNENIPVLLETPAGLTITELNYIWKVVRNGSKIQVAEQYQYYPYFSEIFELIESGTLGTVESLVLSCLHGYHAASVARRILKIQNDSYSIDGRCYKHRIVETDSRNGIIEDGRIAVKEQNILRVEFEGNKQLLYFFDPVQYRSRIRSKTVIVYGERGEINNFDVRYINTENQVISKKMEISNEKNDEMDMAAVKNCLIGMKDYIEKNIEFYSIENALNDAYMSIVMEDSVKKMKKIKSKKQLWQK
jgi:predicted dehydrogenase